MPAHNRQNRLLVDVSTACIGRPLTAIMGTTFAGRRTGDDTSDATMQMSSMPYGKLRTQCRAAPHCPVLPLPLQRHAPVQLATATAPDVAALSGWQKLLFAPLPASPPPRMPRHAIDERAHAGPTAEVLLDAIACSRAWQQQLPLPCAMPQPSQLPCAHTDCAIAVLDAIACSRVWQQYQLQLGNALQLPEHANELQQTKLAAFTSIATVQVAMQQSMQRQAVQQIMPAPTASSA